MKKLNVQLEERFNKFYAAFKSQNDDGGAECYKEEKIKLIDSLRQVHKKLSTENVDYNDCHELEQQCNLIKQFTDSTTAGENERLNNYLSEVMSLVETKLNQ